VRWTRRPGVIALPGRRYLHTPKAEGAFAGMLVAHLPGTGMRVSPRTLAFLAALLVALPGPVLAQRPTAPGDEAVCAAQLADIEAQIDDARARGRMLLRRELDQQLAAVQARCNGSPAQASRAASIARLEQEVEALRAELARAEEQLRRLRNTSP
jgi:uncharacterized protein YukE